MRKIFFIFIFLNITNFLIAQTNTENKQNQAIADALRRIAETNNKIENIIYDGMTYLDVILILNQKFDINHDTNWLIQFGLQYQYTSYHSNYVIFWTDSARWENAEYEIKLKKTISHNPVVIGYANINDKKLKHNVLR